MSDLINKQVKITNIEAPKPTKDDDGNLIPGKGPFKVRVEPYEKGVSYIVWKSKKDGSDSAAYKELSQISPANYGGIYEIAYAEEEREFEDTKGITVKYTQRTIRAMRPYQGEQGEEQGGHVEDIEPRKICPGDIRE